MTSLKTKLKTAIRLRGYVSNDDLYQICHSEGHKFDTATRRLREMADPKHRSYTPEIVKDEWGNAIHGYKWVEGEYTDRGSGQTVNLKPKNSVSATPTSPTNFCCYSYLKFKIHSKDCESLKEKEIIKTLF